MPPFHFRLEQVLRYRTQLEDQAKQALAVASAQLAAQKEQTTQLRTLLAEHAGRLANPATCTVDELWLIRQYVTLVQHDLDASVRHERELEQAVAECRADLTHKAKDRKLLDKLKEKQAEKHTKQHLLIEQRVYDETATIRSHSHSF